MLKTQDFVDFLSEKMNAVKDSVQFNIVAELGEHKNDGKFHGVVRRVDAPFEKVGDMVAANYRFVVELSVPTGRSNKNVLKLSEIVDSVVESYHRTTQTMGSGSGELFFQLTSTEDFEIKAGVGAGVGLAFGVKVFYTENAVSKGNEVWKLDGAIIPFKTRTLSMVREGATFEVPNKDFSEALFKKQTRTYSFELDYNEESLVCSSLAKALFENSFDNVYTLKFYDGKTFTEASPFEAKVSLSSNSESRADDMTPTVLRVVFSDVPVSTVFEIGLCDFDFDIGSEDTLYFDSQEQQQAFFDNEMVGEYVDLMSESLSSIFYTSQIYRINSLEITPQDAIGWANKNYAVIRVTSGGEKFYYYYYVLKSGVGAKNQIVVDLQLDEIQTFFFNENVKFKDAFIKKAHINRFIENGDRTVSFDGGVDSPLFVREDFKGAAKRMIRREVLKPQYDTVNSEASRWLQENVVGWMYAFLPKKADGYDMYNKSKDGFKYYIPYARYSAFTGTDEFYPENIVGATGVLCAPIMKSKGVPKIYCYDEDKVNYIIPDANALRVFARDYAVAFKFSIFPPFFMKLNSLEEYGFSVEGNVLKVKGISSTQKFGGNFFIAGCVDKTTLYSGVILVENALLPAFELSYFVPTKQLTFPKSSREKAYSVFCEIEPLLADTNFLYKISKQDADFLRVDIEWFTNTEHIQTAGGGFIEIANTEGTVWSRHGVKLEVFKEHYILSAPVALVDDRPSEFFGWKEIKLSKRINGIVGAKKSSVYNPKLLSEDFYSLKLTNERGAGFEYDLQKLNSEKIETLYTEPITPDISRSYFRVCKTEGVFIDETSQNLTGFVESADMSLMADNTHLGKMLAENKNYYMQKQMSIASPLAMGAVSGLMAGGPIGAVVGTVAGAIGGIINQEMTQDNMRNSPNEVANANGSVPFNIACTRPGAAIEEYDILHHEKDIINEQMFRYGFNYNKNGDIKDFVNTRKYFNFVQATIGTIQTSGVSLSNEIRTKFRERFERGVRFWHYSDGKAVSYENENYERWLEENSVELEYVVSGGSINIGLAGRNGGFGTTGLAYKWAVYLNDEYVGDYEGVTANNHKITIPTSVSGLNKVNLVCLLENQDYCARSIAFSGGGFDIDSTGLIKVTGYGTAYTGAGAMPKACFAEAFRSCTDLITPPDLPSMNVGEDGYFGMFSYCPNLIYAQDLPATTLSPHCYSNMYRFSENLTNAMEVLPAEIVPDYAYQAMFGGTGIKISPRLPAKALGSGCYSAMFSGSALEVAPELPATELASSCYALMFNDCTLLTEVICHFFDEEGLGMFYTLYAPNWLSGIYTVGKLYSPFANINQGLPPNWTAEEL